MQNHTGTEDLSETLFFTSELEGSHIYRMLDKLAPLE